MYLSFALSMSVPTAQLEELHLSGGMPPHTRSMSGTSASSAVRNRAIIMRDVLSSFEPDLLPSEYNPVVFQEIINRTDPPLDPSYHVRNVDLDGTLFRLGSYLPEWFAILGSIKSKYDLVISYCQRLEERFERIFSEYSELPDPPAANMEPSEEVERMITKLREYYENARKDRRERHAQRSTTDMSLTNTIDRRFALMLVKQLRALCERSTVRPAQRRQRSPRTPTSTKSYLFQEIIGNASPQTGFFALDVLEECSAESLRDLQPDQDRLPGLRTLQMLLEEKGASSEYQTRFAQLVTQEEEEEE